MIRLFLADDHAVVRLGLRQLLAEAKDFEVVGEADNGRAVLTSPLLTKADVLVLDLSLPRVGGIEVLRRVRAQQPGLAVVVLSMHPAEQFARRVLQAGAFAYVSKDRPPAELLQALRLAASRGAPTSEPPREPTSAHAQLTAREHQVFLLLVTGRTVAEIAAELDVHSCTVSNHLAKVREKLGARTTAELTRYALEEGLLGAPPDVSAREE